MNVAPRCIASTATTRAGEQPQAGPGQAADRPFGEDSEALLDAFIAGEAGAEDRRPCAAPLK